MDEDVIKFLLKKKKRKGRKKRGDELVDFFYFKIKGNDQHVRE
jgi:hypothetical protein